MDWCSGYLGSSGVARTYRPPIRFQRDEQRGGRRGTEVRKEIPGGYGQFSIKWPTCTLIIRIIWFFFGISASQISL